MFNSQSRVQLLVLCYYWFVRFIIYFGLNYQLTYANSSMYESSLALGVAELIATFYSGYVRLRYPMRSVFYFSLLIITVVSLSMYYYRVSESCNDCPMISVHMFLNTVLDLFRF